MRVVLVDLDLQFGDVGLALGLTPEQDGLRPGDVAAARSTPRSSTTSWSSTSRGCACCSRRAGPTRPERCRASSIRELLDALRSMSDYVVIDTPPSFSPEVITAIDKADSLCVVGDARCAVAQEHAARAGDARADADSRGEHHGRSQPRGQPGRRHRGRRARSCSAARPTCWCRATATSRARSTRRRRSSPAPRPPTGAAPSRRSPASSCPKGQAPRWPRPPAGAHCCDAERGPDMELHERLRHGGRLVARRVRRAEEPGPPGGHRRTRSAALRAGPRARRRCTPASSRRSAPSSTPSRAWRARTASGWSARSPTTRSATARSRSCSRTPTSPRSWSTARTTSGSSAAAGSTTRACASTTSRTCAGSSTRSSRRSGGASTRPRRWSTPASPTAAASTR